MGLPKPYLKPTIEGEWDIGVSWGPEDSTSALKSV